MTMDLGGAVAIWHDIAPEGLAEFYAWHGEEHMPERAGIPGFLRGRRFIAFDADVQFFNLYDTASPDVVKGPDYEARLNNPTPRTLSAVKHFRNVARSLCSIVASEGSAQGGVVATIRYDIGSGSDASHIEVMKTKLLPSLARAEGVAAVQLLAADLEASGYVNAEQRQRGSANAVPPFALVIEGWGGEAEFGTFMRERFSDAECARAGIAGPRSLGFYRHQITVPAPAAI